MLCSAYVFHFILDSFLENPLYRRHLLKQTPCFGPIGVRFRQFLLQCTLIIQFQQASNCSKLTANTRKGCEICSNLTITTYQNDVIDIVLVFLLLALDIFYNFFLLFLLLTLKTPLYMFRADLYRKTSQILLSQWLSLLHLNNTHFL